MKKLLSVFLMLLSFTVYGQMIENFDDFTNNTNWETSFEGGSALEGVENTTDKVEGTASLYVNASIASLWDWGSYAQFIYTLPDGEAPLNYTLSDSLSIWIKVITPPTHPEYMVFRIHLGDRITEGGELEQYIYENLTVLDGVHDWVQLKIPLVEVTSDGTYIPDSTGFVISPTSWGGFTYNDRHLNLDKIVQINLGIIVSGYTAGTHLPADSLQVAFDGFERTGVKAIPYIVFNGIVVPSDLSQFVWGQSALTLEEGAGATPNTNALKWVQGDEYANGWTGIGFNINPAWNMQGGWQTDSLKIKIKAPGGTGPLRAQFESATAKVGTVFQPIDDDQWHEYLLPLREMVPQDATTGFDSSAVTVFGLMAEESGVAGRILYLDDIWTGNPTQDVIPPDPPTELVATSGSYVNTLLWTDTPNESGESYTLYYSAHQITDLEASDVEAVSWPLSTLEDIETLDHVLRAPATDQSVTYYYAATCQDKAGNVSAVSDNTAPITNVAQGVTIINPTAPTNFAADGDLSDWAGITPFRIFPSDGTGHVVTNQTIDGDADLSVLAYVAMDNDYLYVAFDVVDDVVSTDTTKTSYLIDAPDLFLGLYNWHGKSHTSYQDGSEPDYHFRFGRNAVILDNISGTRLLEQGDADYYWDERFEPGYVVEAKISFSDLAAARGDDLFTPIIGKRIPIDFAINDNDEVGTDTRQGILTYSQFNEDLSYQDVSRWQYTWIGDSWVGVENEENTVQSYELSQNYPNPFNPSTQISYAVEEPGLVTLKVYDMLGKEIATLVNDNQNPGTYVTQFNASNLASGIYLYKLQVNSFVSVKKMILVK